MTRMVLSGDVVDVESKPWDFNGRQGTSHAIFIRADVRGSSQRVKVTEQQVDGFAVGDQVDLPVDVFAQASDFGGAASLRVALDPEIEPAQVGGTGRGAPSLSAAV